MATMKRCLAQLTLSGRWGSEHLWAGLEVNFDRELAPGFTVGDAVVGRDDCFEDAEPPVSLASEIPVLNGFVTTVVAPNVDLSIGGSR